MLFQRIDIKKRSTLKGVLVGLVSDTHIPDRTELMPERVQEVFREAEVSMIIHAGDFVSQKAVKILEQIAPVMGVSGNMDYSDIKERYPRVNSKEMGGKKIGVVHDAGTYLSTKKAYKFAKENGFDIFIFGHTHKQTLQERDGILLINPGSPTNPLPPFIVKPTVALLRIDVEVNVEFILI